MITLRKSQERGRSAHGGWLQSAHTFSFGDYFDIKHQGHGNLRVINDDTVAAGKGFGTHGHRDMEIISYVLDGELAHKDSMGNGETGAANSGIIRPGDVQRMSAGTGVTHSELNNLQDRSTHFLQIWILPKFKGIKPGYEQKHFDREQRQGRLTLVASRTGENGSVSMNADASIHAGLFDAGERFSQSLDPARLAYVHLARGKLTVNGHELDGGDGALLDGETELTLANGEHAEVLVFDLARD
ncbi:pirin family protein [Pollutimonas harenae]|uniref:Pirin family protein n=1 Tax=Pollutimonas harenae TaxID=657015 RepID=A0A853GXD7_9BURK|nr:pirin family protein [Pollutimonas harenae]NYT85416.1 pirin family protein [Pollutimonas harenae]TEA70510.1 pirin family protein [Pollutimonas harenae]